MTSLFKYEQGGDLIDKMHCKIINPFASFASISQNKLIEKLVMFILHHLTMFECGCYVRHLVIQRKFPFEKINLLLVTHVSAPSLLDPQNITHSSA